MVVSLMRGIPVLALVGRLRMLVDQALVPSYRFHPVVAPTWDDFQDLCMQSPTCVVGTARPDRRELASRLRRLELLCPGLQVVLVTDQPVQTTALERDLSAAGIVRLPHGEAEFLLLLNRLSFQERARALGRRVAECWTVPDQLRGAVWQYLRLCPRDRFAVGDSLTVLEGSKLEVIAEKLGTTAKTIRRQAGLVGLDLRALRYCWICVATAAVHEFDDVGWDELAQRVGYASLSGLSGLYRRRFGMTLRQVQARPVELLLVRFEGETLRPLLEYQARNGVA